MSLAATVQGGTSNNLAEVDANHNQLVKLPLLVAGDVGGVIAMSQIDDGSSSGTVVNRGIDIDTDYKTRVAVETLLDEETLNYSSGQNFKKHNLIATTMAPSYSTGGFVTNNTNITTLNTGICLRTYAMFSIHGATTLYAEAEGSFSAQPTTNTIISPCSLVIPAGATPFSLVDGAEFRLNSSGLLGVISSNGTETQVGPFSFTAVDGAASYTNNKKYQFIIQITERDCLFWINNILVGSIPTPVGQGQPCMAASLCFAIRHAIVGGAAGSAISYTLNNYTISTGGAAPGDTLATIGNRIWGAYQGLSGATAGSLATYPNSANPTAAVPSNTALTANLLAGLGGQVWETATLAVTPVDGILMDYTVPMGTVSIQGRRLSLKGLYLSTSIQTLLAGGPLTKQYCLAWGHTAASMATTDTVTSKAPCRIALPPFQQTVTLNQAANTIVAQSGQYMDLGDAGIVVNPGEHLAIVTKHIGTVMTAGTFAHQITFIYGWL